MKYISELSPEQAQEWSALLKELKAHFGKVPDLQAIVYLIGIQELGKGNQRFTKEEKQDLMHIAICKLMSYGGYYELEGVDQDGWPHWKLAKKLPFFDLMSQEALLKLYILEYFREIQR